jgi:hypothetical protein
MADKRKAPKKPGKSIKPSSREVLPPPRVDDPPSRPMGLENLRTPIQSEGVPQRPYLAGGPARPGRIGVALRVLNDPVARSSFSRIYSGQSSRRWSR